MVREENYKSDSSVDESEILGEDGEIFLGSQEELVMTWCHYYEITLRARHIPGWLNVMADTLSRSNQIQST